jgi:succinoglycan biosynthesis transport protein ExoP
VINKTGKEKRMEDIGKLDVKKYWQIILGRKYVFIITFMVVVSVIVWGSFFIPKRYKADSTVFIERNIVINLVRGMVESPSIDDSLKVLSYSMNSREMLMKVIRSLDLDVSAKNQDDFERLINDFRKNTQISVKGGDLFMVSYTGNDPKLVKDYVNSLVSIYVEENTRANRKETSSASQFLTDQIAHYKNKLDESENKLSAFRIENGLYYASDEKTLVTDIKSLTDELNNTKMQINEYDAKTKKIEAQISGEEPLTLAFIDNEQNENSDLSIRLKKLENSLPILLTKYEENYPEVIRVKAELEVIKKQLDSEKQNKMTRDISENDPGSGTSVMNPVYQKLREDRLRLESDKDSLKAKESTLTARIRKIESELKNMPQEQKKLSELMRERQTNQQVYENLIARLGKAEVSEQMELEDKGSTFRIVDPAVLPAKPVSPDRVNYILFGIFAGISSAFGLILLLEYFDHSIKDVDSLRSSFNLPVLAVIPIIITEEDIRKSNSIEKKVYAVSILYMTIIGGLFLKEIAYKFLR